MGRAPISGLAAGAQIRRRGPKLEGNSAELPDYQAAAATDADGVEPRTDGLHRKLAQVLAFIDRAPNDRALGQFPDGNIAGHH